MKYKITFRKTITDPIETKRRLNEFWAIFERKEPKEKSTPPSAEDIQAWAKMYAWIRQHGLELTEGERDEQKEKAEGEARAS